MKLQLLLISSLFVVSASYADDDTCILSSVHNAKQILKMKYLSNKIKHIEISAKQKLSHNKLESEINSVQSDEFHSKLKFKTVNKKGESFLCIKNED
jgi:hypothetical protein